MMEKNSKSLRDKNWKTIVQPEDGKVKFKYDRQNSLRVVMSVEEEFNYDK